MKTADISAVVLAGGKSTRMGENKLLLPLGAGTIVSNLISTLSGLFSECVVVTDHPHNYASLPVRITGDLISSPQKNSLVGIHAGLSVSQTAYSLVLAGDMPFVKPALLQELCDRTEGFDVVIPRQGQYLQPLCALYHKNCLPYIEKLLANNHYKILDFYPYVNVRSVDVEELRPYDSELLSFFNVNTPEDYRQAKIIASR